jgi:multicomponent Na+:H+ antiporter subunit G
MSDTLGFILISIGLAFDFIGCLGLVRYPDVYSRLQVTTKCVTLGTCCILLGIFSLTGFTSAGMKALLCMFFLVFVAPVVAHALSRGAHRAGVSQAPNSIADDYAADQKRE